MVSPRVHSLCNVSYANLCMNERANMGRPRVHSLYNVFYATPMYEWAREHGQS